MYLLVDNTKPQIAQEDIVCYKILRPILNREENKVIGHKTYYEEKQMEPGHTYYDSVSEEFGDCRDLDEKYLQKGVFHVFLDENDACEFWRGTRYSCAVYKCIIPKGSVIYKGFYHQYCYDGTYHRMPGIGAKRLKIVEYSQL